MTVGWLNERSRNGGVDEIPLPAAPGRLFLCGKHFIGPDAEAAMERCGATVVVCLNERDELEARYPEYVRWLSSNWPGRAIWHPIPDLHAPALVDAITLVDELTDLLRRGENLLLHCGAGIGRAGTTAVCVLLNLGLTADVALATVGAHRPMAGPEVGVQRDLVDAIEAHVRSTG